MQPLEPMKSFFNRRSKEYDTVHPATIDGGIESKDILASLLPEDTKTLLDLGIGTGLELRAIFKRFPHMKVTGVDIAEEMLKKLKEKYPTQAITLYPVSYFSFTFEPNTYDAILSVMSFHHYTHSVKAALYGKIYKALKPGCVYLESDYMLSEKETPDAQAVEDALFAEYNRLIHTQRLDPSCAYHFDTPCTVSNQIRMLQEAGFQTVTEVWQKKNNVVLKAVKSEPK